MRKFIQQARAKKEAAKLHAEEQIPVVTKIPQPTIKVENELILPKIKREKKTTPDPPLTVVVVHWDGHVSRVPAHQAISHVTGTSFKDVEIIKRELKKRDIKLATGLRNEARVRELSRRLEKAILTEQAKEDRKNGRDRPAIFRERLKLISEANASKQRGLMDAAIMRSDMLHVTTLVSRGAVLPNYMGPMEFTPLIRAAFVSDVEAVQRLIQLGAHPDFENNFHETALLWACTVIDGNLCTPGLLGGAYDEKNIIDIELSERRKKAMSADVNKENYFGVLPLFAACECGNLKTVELLLKHGVKVNKKNRFGLTALMVAARFGHEKVCYMLLQNGAHLEDRDKGNRKAETWAIEAGFTRLASVLKREAWRWAKKKEEEQDVDDSLGKEKQNMKKIGVKGRLWRVLRLRSKAMKMVGEWQVLRDASSGKEFYYNATTDVTQWEMPPSLKEKANNTWHEEVDPKTGATYYWNDAGESTYNKPLALDDSWKSKKAAPTTAKEIQNEMDRIFAAFGTAGKKTQPFQFTLPELSQRTDGYIGVARIKAMVKIFASDRVQTNKNEWDQRRGGVVGTKKVLLRCQNSAGRCEFCLEARPMVVCIPCDAMFCMDCMRSSSHSTRYPQHRCKLVSQVTRDIALTSDNEPEEVVLERKNSLDKISVAMDDDDEYGNNIEAKSHNRLLKSSKQHNLKDSDEKEEEDLVVIPPQPKDREYRQTMAFEVDRWAERIKGISKVVKPAHAAYVALGGYAVEPPTPRERRIAEEKRLKRWKKDLYTEPKEHEIAMFLAGLGRHAEAVTMLNDLMSMQEKRLGVEAPAIAVTMAYIAKVMDDSGQAADATGWFLRALDQLAPGDKKYNKIFDALAYSMIHSGLSHIDRMTKEEMAVQHRLLPAAFARANRINERHNRTRMALFDEDAEEKPISLTEASNPADVMAMLNDAKGMELFIKFSRTESQGSTDVVLFWQYINKLQILSRKKDFNIEEGEPRQIVHDVFDNFIKPQKIKCITVKQYRKMMHAASTGDFKVHDFSEAQGLVFNVIREGMYRRFLVSPFGGEYLWEKTLTERLRRGLIKGQGLIRKLCAMKRVIKIRALLLRTHHVNAEIERLHQSDILAAIILQKRYRGWVARTRVVEARKKIKRLHLLQLYVVRKRRVVMATRIQRCWVHSKERWPAKVELRKRLCTAYGRRWNTEEGTSFYWDFRQKKNVLRKPRAMGDEEIPLRVVCACEKSIVTRYCVVCEGEPECDECYFKRHGNDDLVDDISAAKVLGTASFAMAVPMHRHGWLEFTPETLVCMVCKIRHADRVCKECVSPAVAGMCKPCYEDSHRTEPTKLHIEATKLKFRLHYRGIEDLDSDEEDAYRPLEMEEDEEYAY